MTLLWMLIGTTLAQVTINKIESNSGYTEIGLGKVDVVKDYNTILHIVNPLEIETIINALESNIYLLKFESEQNTTLIQQLGVLRSKTKTLIPHRHKRGLFNFLGTAHKWIYGTMDDEDRKEIEGHLETIDINNHKIINNINNQVRINKNFNESFTVLKNIIEQDRKQIMQNFNNFNHAYQTLVLQTKYIDCLLKIKILDDKISLIQDNIASSRLKIVHSNILSPQEIEMYDIDLNKLRNVKLGTLTDERLNIIFAIMIPKTMAKLEKKLRIPITNYNYEEFEFEAKEIVKFENKTYDYEENKVLGKLRLDRSCIETQN